jgi:hypothetical protein
LERSRTRLIAISSILAAGWATLGAVPHTVSAETLSDCLATRQEARRTARAESDREGAACHGDRQCLKEASAKWERAAKQIDDAASACRARTRAQAQREPNPALHWKPGDPSPQAKDGRRYIMSCNGKILGMYKPGGAMEVELKSRPGNCIPRDDWGPGGFAGRGTQHTCYTAGGSAIQYSGNMPDSRCR